ncbi:hypothetical protein C823_008045 [Eubacterium plexicaudatum ASF492]|nr:hypothetical protein C823_008045 [Eubacterium plexicaudatum ASF492]
MFSAARYPYLVIRVVFQKIGWIRKNDLTLEL